MNWFGFKLSKSPLQHQRAIIGEAKKKKVAAEAKVNNKNKIDVNQHMHFNTYTLIHRKFCNWFWFRVCTSSLFFITYSIGTKGNCHNNGQLFRVIRYCFELRAKVFFLAYITLLSVKICHHLHWFHRPKSQLSDSFSWDKVQRDNIMYINGAPMNLFI